MRLAKAVFSKEPCSIGLSLLHNSVRQIAVEVPVELELVVQGCSSNATGVLVSV